MFNFIPVMRYFFLSFFWVKTLKGILPFFFKFNFFVLRHLKMAQRNQGDFTCLAVIT